jgi:hypothetical protein
MPQVPPADLKVKELFQARQGQRGGLYLSCLDHITATVPAHRGKHVFEIDLSLTDRQVLVRVAVIIMDVDVGEA